MRTDGKSIMHPSVLNLSFGNELSGDLARISSLVVCPDIIDRVLVAMDRFSSAALGRPCAIQDEE